MKETDLKNTQKADFLKKIQIFLKEKAVRPNLSDDENVQRVIIWTSIVCAIIAMQPIPFADIFILTPVQVIMALVLSEIRDKNGEYTNRTAKDRIEDLVKDIGLVVIGGQTAQHIAITLYKIGLPFLGGFMTFPLVFGLTYGMGKVLDFYFKTMKQKDMNSALNELDQRKKELKRIFKESQKEGKILIKKVLSKEIKTQIKKIRTDKNKSYLEKIKEIAQIIFTAIMKPTKRRGPSHQYKRQGSSQESVGKKSDAVKDRPDEKGSSNDKET